MLARSLLSGLGSAGTDLPGEYGAADSRAGRLAPVRFLGILSRQEIPPLLRPGLPHRDQRHGR
jgi:hypothetical protein